MKKLLFVTNGIMLMLLLLSNTINHRKQGDNQPTVFHDMKLGVDPELARDMVANFRGDIWNSRQIKGMKYLDSRSVWFSLAKLKKFIKDIEDKTPQACQTDSFNLGIRIYFGDYPTDKWDYYKGYANAHHLPVEYKGLHSVVMVPTIYNEADGFHYDFDPRRMRKGCEPTPIKDVMDNLVNLKLHPPPVAPGAPNTIPDTDVFSNKLAYMIMPDNLDNKALFYKTFDPGTNPALPMRGPAYFPAAKPPVDPSFANAGTLIPPPYPADQAPAKITNAGNGGNETQSYTKKMSLPGKFHVPYSGASFMRWVDGTNVCGWNEIPIGSKKYGTVINGVFIPE